MSAAQSRNVRRMAYTALFCLLVYGGVIGTNRYFGGKALAAMVAMPIPTATVSVAAAQAATWPEHIDAVATLEARQGAELSTQTAGLITQVLFQSGDTVKQGQLLVQLNDNQAKAQLAKDQAVLENAQLEMQRQRKLIAKQATSQETEQSAQAQLREAQAAVQADQAQLANLQIRAPFDGHLGLRSVSAGQYVAAGSPVVDIQQWNPLRVVFDLPQRELPKIALGDPVSLSVNGYPNKTFDGRISAFGASVESGSRSIQVEARIANPNDRLRPGMFGQLQVRLGKERQVVAVPRTALSYNTYGEYLYVIGNGKSGLVARQRLVQVGAERGDRVQISDGIKPGEKVVTSGQVKLFPGAPVRIVGDPALAAADGGAR